MNIERILEIGVAVEDLEAACYLYMNILQAKPSDIVVETNYYDIRVQMCRVGNVDFELMEPINDNNVIGKFLKKRGQGLHHIAFKVPNIFQAMEWVKKSNMRVISDPPISIGGTSAIFIDPKASKGVMFELIEGLHHWVEGKELPGELRTDEEGKSHALFQGVIEIGVAVTDLEATAEVYERVLGAVVSEIIKIDQYKMQMMVCRIGNVNLKLMKSLSAGGVISKFTKKHGQGLHHVTLKVSDLDKAISQMKQNKVELINENPEVWRGIRFAFVHPKSFGGLMLELSEGQHEWFSDR